MLPNIVLWLTDLIDLTQFRCMLTFFMILSSECHNIDLPPKFIVSHFAVIFDLFSKRYSEAKGANMLPSLQGE